MKLNRVQLMFRTGFNLSFLTFLIAAPAFAQDRVAVSPGDSVAIGQHVGWTSKCALRKTSIKVTKPPTSGKLKILNAEVPVPETAAVGQKNSTCTGRKLRGKVLMFTAAPDTPGKQTISYEVRYDGISSVQKRSVAIETK